MTAPVSAIWSKGGGGLEPLVMALIAGLVLGVAAWGTARFARPASRLFILDHPNARSMHDRPKPRTGGLAILLALALGVGLATVAGLLDGAMLWMGAGALLVAGISFRDDLAAVSPLHRLMVHALAATIFLAGAGVPASMALPSLALPLPPPVASAFGLLFVIWSINLYNFMDGMDGFAGGVTVIGFVSYAALGWRAGADGFAILSLLVGAAGAGFLIFNFPPARIFMGDAGASTLGFLAAALTVWAERAGVFPLWAGVLVFSPFYVDATVTLIRRLVSGEKVWEAHRSHYYQRLVQLGWSHRRTVLTEYLLMVACSLSALAALALSPAVQWAVIGAWALVYGLLMVGVTVLEGPGSPDERGAEPVPPR